MPPGDLLIRYRHVYPDSKRSAFEYASAVPSPALGGKRKFDHSEKEPLDHQLQPLYRHHKWVPGALATK